MTTVTKIGRIRVGDKIHTIRHGLQEVEAIRNTRFGDTILVLQGNRITAPMKFNQPISAEVVSSLDPPPSVDWPVIDDVWLRL